MKNRLIGLGLASSLLLTGCPEQGVSEFTNINSCYDEQTNVEPTYIPGTPGYSDISDPTVLEAEQRRQIEAGTFEGNSYGIGTLVCMVEVGRQTGWGGEEKQVLTQDAIRIGQKILSGRGVEIIDSKVVER